MHLTLNRERCGHQLTACEECFAEFLKSGQIPPRGCIGPIVDDGAPELVVKVLAGGQVGTLVITERNRARVIYEGWTKFVRMPDSPPTDSAREGESDGQQKTGAGVE